MTRPQPNQHPRLCNAVIIALALVGAAPAAGFQQESGPPTSAAEEDFAVSLAQVAELAAWQSKVLGTSGEPWPSASHEAPSEAVFALLDRYDVQADARQREEIRALDQQPAPFAKALAGVVDAFVALDEATHAAYASVDWGRLPPAMNLVGSETGAMDGRSPPVLDMASGEALRELGIDLGDALASRTQFLDAVAQLAVVHAAGVPNIAPTSGAISIPPAIAIDIRGFDESDYTEPFALIVDISGDDIYHNNAGGSNVLFDGCHVLADLAASPNPGALVKPASLMGPGAAAVIDLAGNDIYGDPANPRSCGQVGGGNFGVGILIDRSGDDSYRAGSHGTLGGARLGAGLLFDGFGSDTYHGGHNGVIGGADIGGVALLVDRAGDDTYVAGSRGTNGGGHTGVGMLVDLAGNDLYAAGDLATNGGGAHGGVGVLLDNTGHDTYTAGGGGTNGGGYQGGVGILIDGAGDDTYSGQGASVGGAENGVGVLVDVAGNDSYPDGQDRSEFPRGLVGLQLDVPPLPPL